MWNSKQIPLKFVRRAFRERIKHPKNNEVKDSYCRAVRFKTLHYARSSTDISNPDNAAALWD